MSAVTASQGTGASGDLRSMALFDLPDDADHVLTLAEQFTVPPFTLLDARSGWWKDRKQQWSDLGLRSGDGRTAQTFAAGSRGQAKRDAFMAAIEAEPNRSRETIERVADVVGLDRGSAYTLAISGGVSIFDPVLCEMFVRWFSPTGGLVLDPCAGGSVRGIVSQMLGRHYVGVDLSQDQIDANYVQQAAIEAKGFMPRDATPAAWHQGDSRHLHSVLRAAAAAGAVGAHDCLRGADMVLSCPPYGDLEVYSDDPADLSNMPWDRAEAIHSKKHADDAPTFLEAYRDMITQSVDCLADDRFAVWVIGEIRGPDGFYRDLVGETKVAFELAGARYYNEAILVSPTGSLQLRTRRQFVATRKMGRNHQTILVFCKGDPKRAAQAMDPTIMDALLAQFDPDTVPDEDLSGEGHG